MSRFPLVAVLGVLVLALAPATPSFAQDAAAKADPPVAGMTLDGFVDVGYRFTDVSGSSDSYRELFDLSKGLRIFGVDLHGQAAGESRFADSFSFTASGLGGDPFPSAQFTAKKSHLYDLRVSWRRTRLVDTAPMTPSTIAGFNTQAVTDFHSLSTHRTIGNVSLVLHATDRLQLLLTYDRLSRSGTLGSTASLDFLGSPAAWGSFARANPYAVQGPVAEDADRAAAGVSYSRPRWTVRYKLGYQTLNQTQTLDSSSAPERSINVADLTTAGEPLSLYSATESRRLTAPLSELSFVVRPSERVEWRGEYLASSYRGPFAFDGISQGTARLDAAGTTFSSYDLATSVRGEGRETSQVVEQGVTYRPFDRWAFDVDYRYSRVTSGTTGALASLIALYAGTVSLQNTSETDVLAWRDAVQTVDLTASFAPSAVFSVRPGVRLTQRNVLTTDNGVQDPATSDRERSIQPELTVAYHPTSALVARGSLQSAYSDGSFTRLSPVQRTIAHGVVTLRPTDALSIDVNVDRTDAELDSAGFVSHSRGASATASYAMSDRLTLLGGFDYRSFLATGDVSFLRGTAPTTNLPLNDREIDRVWQAGVTLKATSRISVTATGNFDSTRGADAIFGEPPLYGPSTFPYVTASASYDLRRAGRVSVDLQRTYWLQDILPLNNFRANLLTIHYARRF